MVNANAKWARPLIAENEGEKEENRKVYASALAQCISPSIFMHGAYHIFQTVTVLVGVFGEGFGFGFFPGRLVRDDPMKSGEIGGLGSRR